MTIPIDGMPHDCLQATDVFLKPREDMHNQPITADLTQFVKGSCFSEATGNHADYAIIQLLPAPPCSAQLAEINALTAACKLAEGLTEGLTVCIRSVPHTWKYLETDTFPQS